MLPATPEAKAFDSDQDCPRHWEDSSWSIRLASKQKSTASIPQAAATSFPREEALRTAGLLAFTGGYLEAYTWIVHHVFANAQSANLVFLRVYVTSGEWERAVLSVWRHVHHIWPRRRRRRIRNGNDTKLQPVMLLVLVILHCGLDAERRP